MRVGLKEYRVFWGERRQAGIRERLERDPRIAEEKEKSQLVLFKFKVIQSYLLDIHKLEDGVLGFAII